MKYFFFFEFQFLKVHFIATITILSVFGSFMCVHFTVCVYKLIVSFLLHVRDFS